jgi:hypothetical protein
VLSAFRRPSSVARPQLRRRTLVAGAVGLGVVLSAAAAPAASAAAGAGNPWGALAPMSWQLGKLNLHGYAIDPNTTSPVSVTITRDGQAVRTVTAGEPRAWLSRTFPYYGGRHGWSTSIAVPAGAHSVCATVRNVGAGHDSLLRCVTVTSHNDPVGRFSATHTAAGIVVTGWALDPNVVDAVRVRPTLDGTPTPQVVADDPATVPSWWSANGRAHGFSVTVPADRFAHRLCLTVANVGAGRDRDLGCRDIAPYVTVPDAPTGLRVTNATTGSLTVSWTAPAFDGGAPVTGYQVSIDDTAPQTVPALPTSFTVVNLRPNTTHTFSIAAVNVKGAGADDTIQGTTIAARPTAPQSLTATSTSSSVTVKWRAPADTGGSPVTSYVLTGAGRPAQTLAGTARSVTVTGLAAGTGYSFTLTAVNAAGAGPAARVTAKTGAAAPSIAPQTTPAPVSTSHYLRTLTGSTSHDVAQMKAMGAQDARYNPSGHRYLVLQDIGAQSGSGVILSATTRWISYSALVTAMKAYIDGYATTQKANAPMLLAIGTNNDGSVNSAAGAVWADQVVDPVRAYAAKYPNITVAGANDIEPGFSAGVGASRAWLSGYLGATSAKFVFNGSADGCPTSSGTVCNNGWRVSDLNWLSGGAAPSRTLVLPQIYNSAMPKQWHVISAGGQKLRFAGPLTEWTACDQDGGCSSASNISAWTMLFAAINSDVRTAQASMAYGTDLRID